MKKILISTYIVSLLIASFANAANDAATTSATAMSQNRQRQEQTKPDSGDPPPDPVKYTAPDVDAQGHNADYSSDAGNNAAIADMGLSVASSVGAPLLTGLTGWFGGGWGSFGLVFNPSEHIRARNENYYKQAVQAQTESQAKSAVSIWAIFQDVVWFPAWTLMDFVGLGTTLGHAAINKFMRDATNITASFSGEQGSVTDAWVGPPSRNRTVAVMGKTGVTFQKPNAAVGFNANNFPGLEDADRAGVHELMEYRMNELIEDQRSLKNVTGDNWNILYKAQQRCIIGLASALELKKELENLGAIDKGISAEYKTKPQALNTLASRRALHDALLLLKINVMAARTRVRAEILELDFKPKTTSDEPEEQQQPTAPSVTPTTGG
ncbi:MAG: hypothetical protein II938_01835 [Alphaproteobacteria bacterium]|nr:hypothetical protein [Alphaproteobacteria bacterium]